MILRCLVLLLVLGPMAAWAQSQGILLYERGEYSRAARVLTNEVNNPRRSEKDRARARVYLAAALMELGKRDEAQAQLEELLRTYPEQRVDPALFPPELVELDRVVRAEVETERLRKEAEEAERLRLAAEAERERLAAEEAERRKREADTLQQTPQPEGEVQDSEEPRATSSFRLRPEIFGYVDAVGRSRGYGVGTTVGYGGLEAAVRVLPGPGNRWGVGGEVGYLFGRGIFQPRLALRATGVIGVGLGGGGAVGVRLTPFAPVTLMADLGVEGFLVDDPQLYRQAVVVGSVGMGFNLF
jgi:hypothetical protein